MIIKHNCADTLSIKDCPGCAWENYHECEFTHKGEACRCIPPKEI